MHEIGRSILEILLNADDGQYRGKCVAEGHGQEARFLDYRDKTLLTVLGPVTINRAYYYDRKSHHGWCPKDRSLDIEGTRYSPGVRRMMSKVGAMRPFGLAHEDLAELAGIQVNAKEVERVAQLVGHQVATFPRQPVLPAESDPRAAGSAIPRMYISMDGTGVPMVTKETSDRRGKGEGGQAKTRDAKLGCVVTQTTVDREGRPRRDEQATSYTGAIETAEVFGWRLYEEAQRRGLDRAGEICVLGDGAVWIWNLADEHFYGAVQIVDLYHAREHYWTVAKSCLGAGFETIQWAEQRRIELDDGNVEQVIAAIAALGAQAEGHQELCEREIGYFEKNKERMRYAEFRKRGFFVGSGVMEAGCRTVVGLRLKQSGMQWTVKGANSIIALRCCLQSNQWEDFWESRIAA